MLQVTSTSQMTSVIRIIGTALSRNEIPTARVWAGILKESAARFPPGVGAARLKHYAGRLGAALGIEVKSERTLNDLLRHCRKELLEIEAREAAAIRCRKTRSSTREAARLSVHQWNATEMSGQENGWGTEAPTTQIM